MQQRSFKQIMRRQIYSAIAIGLLLSSLLTLLPSYFIFQANIHAEAERLESFSYAEIDQHLATGWQPHNIELILTHLNHQLPAAQFFLQKAPDFQRQNETKLHGQAATASIDGPLEQLINQAEKQRSKQVQATFLDNQIYLAYPIFFKESCLSCHAKAAEKGEIFAGKLAGTIAMQAPISSSFVSASSMFLFFLIFLLLFIVIGVTLTNRFFQNQLISPLQALSQRIGHLKLSTQNQQINWQRQPQQVIEIDQIDAKISEHIRTLQGIYQKLDELVVTEQETGLFHRERFHEVMHNEILRSQRYHHPFSIIVLKLVHTTALEKTAELAAAEKKSAEAVAFSRLLIDDTRLTDLVFRISENLFIIVAPEADASGVLALQNALSQRIHASHLQDGLRYAFDFQMGYATLGVDGDTSKQMVQTATARMQADAQRHAETV
ncbi:diguanylate cyclase domain-containing protein [Thiomicrorhabdus cannonii]|uniref:diguanylate cyclase domain-containing protein n=1 Tax=Thiomicrorhabdus cannonii TaxID=2748011 RepID=UPI0015BDBABB|nr:diguanylate cyclase [Thiomicrorhabdus cannonii]